MTGERPPLGNGTVRIETQIDAFTPNIRASMYLNFGDKAFEQQVIDYMRRTDVRGHCPAAPFAPHGRPPERDVAEKRQPWQLH